MRIKINRAFIPLLFLTFGPLVLSQSVPNNYKCNNQYSATDYFDFENIKISESSPVNTVPIHAGHFPFWD
jgi:hypothetical protein